MRATGPITPHSLTGAAAGVQARAIAALTGDLDGFQQRYLERFGRVLNADNASELFEEYTACDEARTLFGLAVRAPAAALIDSLFVDLLAEPVASGRNPVVVFTAGGNAAGKSSTVKPGGGAADIVFDSTLSSLDPSAANIERALAAGRDVAIRYIWRNPVKALTDGALPRAMGEGHGRVVTVRGLAGTHIGSGRALLRLVETYAADPRVTVFIYSNIEMSTLVPLTVDALKERTYDDRDVLEGRLFDALDAAQRAGAISDIVCQAATGLPRRVGGDRG